MSQEKVNKYKLDKNARKEQIRIEKRNALIRKSIGIVVAVSLVAWIGISSVNLYLNSRPRPEITVDYSAIETFISDLNTTE